MVTGMTVRQLRLFLKDADDEALVVIANDPEAKMEFGLDQGHPTFRLEAQARALGRCDLGRFDTFGSAGFMSDELTAVDENPRKIIPAVCLFPKG